MYSNKLFNKIKENQSLEKTRAKMKQLPIVSLLMDFCIAFISIIGAMINI